jgi:hypothetical protein
VNTRTDNQEREPTEWETYCSHCAGIAELDAERCPHCGTKDFDPATDDDEFLV